MNIAGGADFAGPENDRWQNTKNNDWKLQYMENKKPNHTCHL